MADQVYSEIMDLLKEKKYSKARMEILKYNDADIAEIITEVEEEFDMEKAIVVFRMLPKDISAQVFAYLPADNQVEIINVITDQETKYIMDELGFDDMIDVLEELPANVVSRILSKVSKEERKLINSFLNYPEDSAGSLMTIDYIGLRKEMSVGESLKYIKEHGMDQETIYTCYVMDSARKLEGIVSLRTLVVTDENAKIDDLMHTDMIYVNVLEDREEVANIFKKYDFLALPVVDNEGRLVGIITVDDILDVIDEENTEDFQKMAGMSPIRESYFNTSVFDHAKSRTLWLLILAISAIITGYIIVSYENVLSGIIALVQFMPMIMGTGGNSGAQASTLIIRGIAVGEIESGDILRVVWKEFRIASIVAIVLCAFNFARIVFLEKYDLRIAAVVCLTLFLVIICAKTIGAVLPICAKLVKIDPAIMANPLIASLTDAISVIIYFALAKAVFGIA